MPPTPDSQADYGVYSGDEVNQHLIYIDKAFKANRSGSRRKALIDGLVLFGIRFVHSTAYLAAQADNQGPFQEISRESEEILTSWILGNRLTDRADEDERRVQMASVMLHEATGLERLAARCIMALPEDHPQRDLNLVRESLSRYLRNNQSAGDVDNQVNAIRDILNFRLEPLDRSLELIQQGLALVDQVSDPDFRHDLRVNVIGYYVALAIEERDNDNRSVQESWAEKAGEILDEMRSEDPAFFLTAAGMNFAGMVMELKNRPSEAAALFASAVDATRPEGDSYQQAAIIEARYRMELRDYSRVIGILSPIVEILEEKYLTAVGDQEISEAGRQFSEVIWNLAFAQAHAGQWDQAVKNLERGKSLRFRYRAALRQSPSGKRLLQLESKLYSLSRGVPVEESEFDRKKVEDWLGEKVSLRSKILEAYRTQRPKVPRRLLVSPSVSEIAGVLARDEAVIILGSINRGGTLVAVICEGDKQMPGGRFLLSDWPLKRWVQLFAGEKKDGWAYALGAPEAKVDHRKALRRLLRGVEGVIGRRLKRFLQTRRVRRLTIVPHLWWHLVPFWALPSLQEYDISMAASTAHFIQTRGTVRVENRKALVVADPTNDLPASLAEADSVSNSLSALGFRVRRLERARATEAAVAAALKGVSAFHFCGHGRSDLDKPTRSALLLFPDLSGFAAAGQDPLGKFSDSVEDWQEESENERSRLVQGVGRLYELSTRGTNTLERRLEYGEHGSLWGLYQEGNLRQLAELWTAGDILTQRPLRKCKLAFLSACEAGGGSIEVEIDEYSGLPAALQLAGVSTIISSMWPVSDALSALYVDLFYRALARARQPANVAAIVRHVSRRLRHITKDKAVLLVNRLRRQTASPRVRFMLEAFAAGLKRGARYPFQDPYDWAAFYVTGASKLFWSGGGSNDQDR